jgi:hypothetical protein
MLRTILMIAIVVWMVGLGFHFGENVLPLLLVVAAIVLVMKHTFAADLLISTRPHYSKKTGRFAFTKG